MTATPTPRTATPAPASAPTPGPVLSTDDAMWQHIATVHAHVEERLATAVQRRHGLGLSEYRALGHLAATDKNELRMQELADKVGLNQSSVTRLVSRLQAAGFTYRDLCPDDRRGVYTVLTDEGRARHAEARPTYEQTLTAALDDTAQASPALGALIAAMRATELASENGSQPGGSGGRLK